MKDQIQCVRKMKTTGHWSKGEGWFPRPVGVDSFPPTNETVEFSPASSPTSSSPTSGSSLPTGTSGPGESSAYQRG